ncbi:hypothetical protein VC83_08395 [Pseudogymnoascus destructans]|uniref:DNA 3'-5' helicase n=1 Tax=Pseudogymnoascus destructans TaxID=655981 RepID=A0A176ZZ63_9PEZI|nr:uncharacterized protein VC83_08395 [Pseudogymnoascus destructans]OAF55127.1 hypothetical protein VC83_08395 [Pseudogymnoascus destructans]
MKDHGRNKHSMKRVDDNQLFQAVRLQTWFRDGKERYWVVDESRQAEGMQATHQLIRDVGEQSSDDVSEEEQASNQEGDAEDQIIRDIEQWKEAAQERRLTLLAKPAADELDPWLRYTGWNEVLQESQVDIIQTYKYAREPEEKETKLQRLLRAWDRILERCLDTLANMDHKDVLKWWASPKNEVASQHPFELHQSVQSVHKCSAVWQRFICYMMRTATVDWEDDTETGVEFTHAQWQSIQQIHTHLQTEPNNEDDQDPLLTAELMRLCMLVVMQDTSKIGLYESPLMHYLAVRGIDPLTKSLYPPLAYTPILGRVLWITRLLMLEIAVPLEPWPELRLQSKEDIESIPERIHKLRRTHLCEGSFSPTSSILSQLAMGKKYNQLHESPANIHWSRDEQTIYYLGMGVELEKVREMCHDLIGLLQRLLYNLAFDSELPMVDLSQIVDSMAWNTKFRQSEYSFINHVKNRERTDVGYQYLLKRARKGSKEWQLLQRAGDGSYKWNDSQKQAYLNQERQFLRKLMVTLHVTGGQPARGPEIGSIKVSNSVYSARNIYVINGQMCFLTMYDKARKRRGNTDYIVRFLPNEVSQVLAQYLIYIRPFGRALDQRESEYLFGDNRGPWAGEELTQALSKATSKGLGVRLTVQSWRHVAIGIAVRHLLRASKTWEKDDEEDEGEFAEGDDEEELEQNTFRHIMVRQSGHGQRVAQAHYAVDGAFLHRLGPELITAYEQASVAWHELLGLAQAEGKGKHGRQASQQLTPVGIKRERRESKHGVKAKALDGLRRIYGPQAQPRSEGQAAALQLVHQPPVTSIIVLPTSSGKSVLFFSVAAMAVDQTVIVVVPFTALVEDIVARGQAAGLHCKEWSYSNHYSSQELVQLLVVSADQAVSGQFLHEAKGYELNGQLAHMFFDECHVAFTDTSYRERLRELWKLRYLKCPFTALTATLMVELEDVLRDRLLIEDAVLLRRSTARPTIRYQVQDSKEEAASAVGLRLLERLLYLPDGKRGVVYVRSYATGDLISSALECSFYKARADDKGETLQKWAQGSGGWIVATGALGTGINIPGIIYVVHIDRPYGLTSFAQQSGRGGREGEG